MEKSFFKFVWRYSKREQIFILVLTVVSFPMVYLSLEIPKMIVNDAIDGRDFPRVILGLEFGQVPYLLLLCGLFLFMVVAINGVKWTMNIAIGMCGERMLRRLRYQLFQQVMCFRMKRFRSTKPGEVVQSLMGEIEPLGGFIGEVIATPAFQGGLLCVYVAFIFVQDWLLGLAAVSLYPLQAWLIPKMQARVIRLNKERAKNNRMLADTLSESVGQISEIHTNDTARWHMAQMSGRLFQNTLIRIDIFRRKFTIKFVNNFINQLTPFFFYSIGGYLVITGELRFGSLVAVLAAYKDLAGPWKEILSYVQRWNDFNGRYVFVVENYLGDDIEPPERIWDESGRARPLHGEIQLERVEGGPGSGGLNADGIAIQQGEAIAVVGGSGGAREALLRMFAGLAEPEAGTVRLGGQVIANATMPQIGRSLAFVSGDPGLVNRSMRENLLYGLLAHPPQLNAEGHLATMRREALLTGNIPADPDGDWIDYEAAGVADAASLEARMVELAERFGLAAEIYAGALASRIDPADAPRWTEAVMAVRAALAASPDAAALEDIVERWHRDGFNSSASLLENLLFALPVDGVGDVAQLATRDDVRKLLAASEGNAQLDAVGWRIATEFFELVETVGRDSGVLDGFPGYPRADVLGAHDLVAEDRGATLDELSQEARVMIRGLAARFVPMRDRLEVIDDATIAHVLGCRARVLQALDGRDDFVLFDEDRFSPALTISDNIIGAKRRFDRKARWRQLEDAMESAISEAGMRDELMRLGLDAPVGAGGSNLTSRARRRVGVIRALVKRPGLVVLDGFAATGRPEHVELRAAIVRELPGATIIWAADDEEAERGADRVLEIGEDGTARMRTAPEASSMTEASEGEGSGPAAGAAPREPEPARE